MTNMMDSFMHCWKKFKLWLALSLLVLSSSGWAATEGIQIKSAELRLADDVYYLHAQMLVTPNPTMEEALRKGVSLYFVTEFELKRPRWYWLNEDIATYSRVSRLSYNALLRQYVVSGVNIHAHSVDKLEDALMVLGEVSAVPIITRNELTQQAIYSAKLTMRLDTTQLPKPLQINALATGKWDLEATPMVWTFKP
ncbi:hypothetical protein SFSGTM_05430 [Sulfuriferula nivalis]|uniref:DUF4390 domain-containing protein n=2 Tax=Sulfuriferula nivalis TaxID=2675298 RepID=A0A809RDX8_9PROT|nr:hypothetical protein SFSGTM_05430 [Sulfuriferula nivalis]